MFSLKIYILFLGCSKIKLSKIYIFKFHCFKINAFTFFDMMFHLAKNYFKNLLNLQKDSRIVQITLIYPLSRFTNCYYFATFVSSKLHMCVCMHIHTPPLLFLTNHLSIGCHEKRFSKNISLLYENLIFDEL